MKGTCVAIHRETGLPLADQYGQVLEFEAAAFGAWCLEQWDCAGSYEIRRTTSPEPMMRRRYNRLAS